MSDINKFPENFLWGTATSSYQIEGAHDVDGKGPSVWDVFSQVKGNIKNEDSGNIACNHYHLWKEDIVLMKKLGVKAYRFSISWPRIFPSGWEVKANHMGLDFYDRLVDELLLNDIIPFITLNHWDIPQGLEDSGGWNERWMVNEFIKYGYHVSAKLGDRVKKWITHNEPWCISYLGYISGQFPPGIKNDWTKSLCTAHHLLLSHGKVIPEIKSNSKNCHVGITLNLNTVTPASKSHYDQKASKFYDDGFNRLFLDPLYRSQYPESFIETLIEKGHIMSNSLDFIKHDDLKVISTKTDFLGVNYYSRAVIRNEEVDENENQPTSVTIGPTTDFGWEVYPLGIYDLLIRLKNDYNIKRIYITENGCSYGDMPNKHNEVVDSRRIEYHDTHLHEIQRAIQDKVNCEGYFAWSFMDNFEWAEGYSQRFGLVWVDFETQERIPKESYYWYKRYIEKNTGEDQSNAT